MRQRESLSILVFLGYNRKLSFPPIPCPNSTYIELLYLPCVPTCQLPPALAVPYMSHDHICYTPLCRIGHAASWGAGRDNAPYLPFSGGACSLSDGRTTFMSTGCFLSAGGSMPYSMVASRLSPLLYLGMPLVPRLIPTSLPGDALGTPQDSSFPAGGGTPGMPQDSLHMLPVA